MPARQDGYFLCICCTMHFYHFWPLPEPLFRRRPCVRAFISLSTETQYARMVSFCVFAIPYILSTFGPSSSHYLGDALACVPLFHSQPKLRMPGWLGFVYLLYHAFWPLPEPLFRRRPCVRAFISLSIEAQHVQMVSFCVFAVPCIYPLLAPPRAII